MRCLQYDKSSKLEVKLISIRNHNFWKNNQIEKKSHRIKFKKIVYLFRKLSCRTNIIAIFQKRTKKSVSTVRAFAHENQFPENTTVVIHFSIRFQV